MDDPSTWVGRTLNGRYQIEDRLGHGGMATVYKATDPNLKRVVAIKMIHPHLATDAEFLRRFKEEATAVAQLRHPNIVQVYDYNADGQNNYIVFEYVAGETLQDRMTRLHKSGRQLSIDKAVSVATQMAEALAYAHNRGMIHRDIKPANIMIDVHDQSILTDFGIVKIMGGTQHTATGATLGTAQYMSPEQIKGGQVDARCDIYSLGVTLFEMVSGRRPFEAESAMTLMMMHINDPVPDLSQLRPDVPAGLAVIIEKALAKEPGWRYQSADEFLIALKALSGDPAAVAAAAAIATPPIAAATIIPPVAAASTVAASETPVSQTAVPPIAAPPSTDSSKRPPIPVIIGGIMLLCVLLMAGLYFGGVFGGGDDNGEESANARASAVAETVTAMAAPTETAVPTNTTEPTPTDAAKATVAPTEIVAPTATIASTATIAPTATTTTAILPTATTTTAILPTATTASSKSVSITGITIDGNQQYVVGYTTSGYTPSLASHHIHFYFNTISEINAGQPGSGPWQLYGGPSPFSQYNVANKPAAATQLCALVANPDHSIQMGSGNCFTLP